MIGIEQYRKILEYKALGLAQTKTAKALGDNLFFCQQILEYERRRLCKGS
ncbi:MAG: hypothetical protein ACOX3R_00945 [Desulfitobacteriia bacterium]